MTVSFFKNVRDSTSPFNRSVIFCLDRIRSGKSKSLIEKIRTIESKDERNKVKSQLPGVCFGGTFKTRSASGLTKQSGLMCLDFDGFKTFEDAVSFRDSISDDNFVFSAWISPSGLGVKVLVKIAVGESNFKGYFEALKKHFDSDKFDDSGKDISRFCFESYDPDLYLNENSLIWSECEAPEIEEVGTNYPVIAIRSDNRIIENLVKWWQSKYVATKGNRNNNLFRLASAFNDFGINKSECEHILMQYQEDGFNASEIGNLIKSAYNKVHQFGTKFFEDTQTRTVIEKQIRAGKKAKEIVKNIPEIPATDIENCIEKIKDEIQVKDFWSYDKEGRIKISPHKYKYWLEQNNFYKYFPTNTNTYTFVKKEQNLIEETNEKRIKDYVLDNLLSRSDIGYMPYDYMAANPKFFTPEFLSLLESSEIQFKEDNASECFLYYRNCVICISEDKITEIDYIDIDGAVWKRQIIDREFKATDHHHSEFRKFLWLIAGKDMQKYNSFKSVIGYLLHSYKNSANNKAIVFNDETISENPNGGSGKGLFWNALANMKKVSSIDGKTFEFTKSFPYQTVSTDTQILVFDDVKKNFQFESLFSLITEGITLEYKGQDAIKLPVQKSPKILITTNYTIGGIGGSFERRKFEVEMSNYFSFKHTPLDEFGHLLFDEWDQDEWLRFDNFMIQCCQFYLKNGLVKHEFNNLDTRKFIKQTSFEFYEWVKNEDNLPKNQRLQKSVIFEGFIQEFPDMKKWLSQKKFKQWIEFYCQINKLEYYEGNSNSIRWMQISGDKPDDNGLPF